MHHVGSAPSLRDDAILLKRDRDFYRMAAAPRSNNTGHVPLIAAPIETPAAVLITKWSLPTANTALPPPGAGLRTWKDRKNVH